ncbi:hypothetical protein L227DRAFT_165939 [Lentinus tigrinus ALCF2SS1-6]|uniref:Uncharacterized protein n=1 Tax=Lentinus tigrinus ALCF2SS1-6 TaxID=1328759 RepID=A0A5C2SCZ7_9APHY|nr:hypothetical protein L227DRAFT_165939 [Lentinus tigrinus ALCF2SS1-6]
MPRTRATAALSPTLNVTDPLEAGKHPTCDWPEQHDTHTQTHTDHRRRKRSEMVWGHHHGGGVDVAPADASHNACAVSRATQPSLSSPESRQGNRMPYSVHHTRIARACDGGWVGVAYIS